MSPFRALVAFAVLALPALARAQTTVSAVTTQKPTVATVSVASPKVATVSTSKVSVSAPTVSTPTVSKATTNQENVASPSVAHVSFGGGGGGGAGGGGGGGAESDQSDREKQVLDEATKGDLDWNKPGMSGHQAVGAASAAETDAAIKAKSMALDAGFDAADSRRLAREASKRVEQAGQAQPPQ